MGHIVCSEKKPTHPQEKIYKANTKYGVIIIPLTSHDIILIKASWPLVKKLWGDICVVAFKKWFSNYPELRMMFKKLGNFPDYTLDELLQTNVMRFHSKILMEVFDELLQTIEKNVDDFVNSILMLGEKHYYYGAEPQYATNLAACFQYAVTEVVTCCQDVENAWDSLLRFTMDCLKMGMRKERKANDTINQNSDHKTL